MLGNYQLLSTAGAWLAMLGYTFQLYFDFAGYSDMAIGLGYMFGLRIPVNFNSPYKALDPSDFWRRWHISLSSCLRDYVYIPLGGNRRGEWNAYRNLLLTMLIGGLWHGANWTFVIWGGYHGALLAAYRRFAPAWDRVPSLLRQIAMFLLALFGWVLFRSTSFGMAADLFAKMFTPTGGLPVEGSVGFVAVLLVAGAWAMTGPNAQEIHANWSPTPRRVIALAAAAGASLAVMLGSGSSPFLYFQF
jgi:alginate O-acetyltransferase complex protein AlgI